MQHRPTTFVPVMVLGLLGWTGVGEAQVTRAVPTTAIERAARVVDATAIDASPVYVLYNCRGPGYEPVAVVRSITDSILTAGLCVAGPLKPQEPDPLHDLIAPPGCTKLKSSKCATDLLKLAVPREEVVDIQLVFRLKNGDSISSPINPDSAEALILSVSAYDKLILPYNLQALGLAQATELRQQFYQRFADAARRWEDRH